MVHEKIDVKCQSVNNYTAEGLMMKNKAVHAGKSNDQNLSDKDISGIVSKLRSFRFVHSIILFGSKARGTEKEKSDIDICIVPEPEVEVTLKERLSLNNAMPENVDISFIDDLPVYIRKRVFLEGRILYTQDMYHVLTLSKINDLEYNRYKRLTDEYHKHVMERVRTKLR